MLFIELPYRINNSSLLNEVFVKTDLGPGSPCVYRVLSTRRPADSFSKPLSFVYQQPPHSSESLLKNGFCSKVLINAILSDLYIVASISSLVEFNFFNEIKMVLVTFLSIIPVKKQDLVVFLSLVIIVNLSIELILIE